MALAGFLVFAWWTFSSGAPADKIEASMLDQATRFAGASASHAGAGDETPSLLPVFPWTVSLLVRLFDPAVWEPRMVSLLATLLSAAAAFLVVRGETKSATLGAAAAGLLLMSQGAAGVDPGGARPESLMFLLGIIGCITLRYTNGIPGALFAAPWFAAACYTHPAGLAFAFAALFHLRVLDPRRMLAYGLTLALIVCGLQIAMTRSMGLTFVSGPWAALWHGLKFAPKSVLQFVGTDVLGALGVLTLATVLSFALPIAPWRGTVGIWTWMAVGALAAGLLATQTGGSPGEALRALATMLVIVGPVSAQRITQHLSNWPGGSRIGGQAVVLTALALQFITLFASGAA